MKGLNALLAIASTAAARSWWDIGYVKDRSTPPAAAGAGYRDDEVWLDTPCDCKGGAGTVLE